MANFYLPDSPEIIELLGEIHDNGGSIASGANPSKETRYAMRHARNSGYATYPGEWRNCVSKIVTPTRMGQAVIDGAVARGG